MMYICRCIKYLRSMKELKAPLEILPVKFSPSNICRSLNVNIDHMMRLWCNLTSGCSIVSDLQEVQVVFDSMFSKKEVILTLDSNALQDKGHLFLLVSNLFQLLAFSESVAVKSLVKEITDTVNIQDVIVAYIRTLAIDK